MELVTLASATAAAGFLAGGASRLAIAGWQRATTHLQQRRFLRRVQSELKEQTQRARMAGQAHVQSSQGAQSAWRVMQAVEIVDESQDVRSFYLQDPLQAATLPNYLPGQFLIVRPALGGADLPARCYSLSDAPGQAWYRISVKRQSTPSHQSLSNWLHDHVRTGDCLLASGPYGDFVIDETLADNTPVVLLAAGIGVTPILSMLKCLLQANLNRRVSVYFQVQDTEHWPFGDLIHSWGKQCPGLQATSYFSRLSTEELPAVESGKVRVGKFDSANVIVETNESTKAHYYLCGPDAWMQSITSGLSHLGVPTTQIHSESFAASQSASHGEDAVDDWNVQFARSGVAIPTSTKPASILQAATELGLNLPAACHSGVCGTCKLKLLKGTVKYPRRPTCAHRPDEVVACVAQAVGSVEVDA